MPAPILFRDLKKLIFSRVCLPTEAFSLVFNARFRPALNSNEQVCTDKVTNPPLFTCDHYPGPSAVHPLSLGRGAREARCDSARRALCELPFSVDAAFAISMRGQWRESHE